MAAVVVNAGSDGNGLLTSLALVVLAPVPIPFLLWWDAPEVFAPPSRTTSAIAAPSPASPPDEPEPVPAERSLTDRWHSRG